MTLAFLVTSLIVVASPGTGVLYTLAVALTQGARPSLAAAFGCTLGIVPHMLAAMLGRRAYLRLQLSLAKHGSLAGHARMSRFVAGLVPYYEYDDAQFFRAGGRGEIGGLVNLHYGQDPGVKFYTHLSDQFGPFHSNSVQGDCRDWQRHDLLDPGGTIILTPPAD